MTIKNKWNQNVLGIVAEYNPIHNGHIYQLNACKEKCGAQYAVAVISGNFTQRGEPALLDKWERAKMAVLAGVDLVVELPFFWACNSAEYFAKGAVELLDGMGVVTHLGFGSECGDIEKIRETAEEISGKSEKYQKRLQKYLGEGNSYPKATMMALEEKGEILKEPNNILAVEYTKALIELDSKIKTITVKRKGASYHQEDVVDHLASGSGIRKMLKVGDSIENVVDVSCNEILKENRKQMVFADSEKYFHMIKMAVLTMSKEEISEIFSVREGLENKIYKEIRNTSNLDELIGKIKSKRYTYTAISRIFSHILMKLKKDFVQDKYIRVLAFNENGAGLLKEMKKRELNRFPVVTNINKEEEIDFSMDVRATDIYNLLSGADSYKNSDFVRQPVRILGQKKGYNHK